MQNVTAFIVRQAHHRSRYAAVIVMPIHALLSYDITLSRFRFFFYIRLDHIFLFTTKVFYCYKSYYIWTVTARKPFYSDHTSDYSFGFLFCCAMRFHLIALACILIFTGVPLVSSQLNHGVLPKIDCCFGSSYSAELAADSRKQGIAIISDYDYADPDPSPINSHVHGAPIQNDAQAPSPAPASSSSRIQDSRGPPLLTSPSPH